MNQSKTDVTIHAYDRNAEEYTKKFMDFKVYKEKLLLFQQSYISPHAYILDIGCGPGNNAKILSGKNQSYNISGVDLSSEMIALAKINAPNCYFTVADIRELVPDKRYDVIIVSFCIVHLSADETGTLIQTIAKMLNNNGSLYLSFMEGEKSGYEKTSFSADDIFFKYYEQKTIKKLLKEHSIDPVETLTEEYQEQDGSVTKDVFIFSRKKQSL